MVPPIIKNGREVLIKSDSYFRWYKENNLSGFYFSKGTFILAKVTGMRYICHGIEYIPVEEIHPNPGISGLIPVDFMVFNERRIGLYKGFHKVGAK